MITKETIAIGYITKTHGLAGEVTAIIEDGAEWSNLTSLFIERDGNLVPYFIERISGLQNKPFLKFEGINSYDEASMLKGGRIHISKSKRAKLKKGEFHDDELIGFDVVDKNYGALGQVKEIQNQGTNRLLVVMSGAKETLIPMNGPFIKSINKTKKAILLELPEGFLNF